MRISKKAFTLIELIVVIAIIWFLGMVWVMTFMEWFSKSRDASRIAALQNMSMALETYLANHTTFPLPDDYVEIKYSWETVTYQGKFGKNVVSELPSMKQAPKDPKDNTYYTYTVSADKKNYELLVMMEWEPEKVAYNPFVEEVYADDYTDRIPKTDWESVWVVLGENNNPIEDITKEPVDLASGQNYGDVVLKVVYSDNIKSEWSGKVIWPVLAANKYPAPANCPEWFIPVPWNPDFPYADGSVKWFCVAKYEMSCANVTEPDSNAWSTGWNTIDWSTHSGNCQLVSRPGLYPIADITEWEAIEACKRIWGHLITNNEWMTIARNIESVASNWSSGKVWEGYIYNGVSDSDKWCWDTDNTKSIYTDLPRDRAAKTGPGWVESCDKKRVLTLSNWQQIWDLAGNVWEYVNKANTLDWSNYNVGQTSIWWASPDDAWDTDGIYSGEDMLKYWSILWLWSDAGMGSVYYAKGTGDNVFRRGNAALGTRYTGIFSILLSSTDKNRYTGTSFRCVISK